MKLSFVANITCLFQALINIPSINCLMFNAVKLPPHRNTSTS